MGNLTNTQAAYRFYNDRFNAGMRLRAQNLWADGYRVTPLDDAESGSGADGAALPTTFLVYKEDQQETPSEGPASYVVDPLNDTCTCPFFTKQDTEPLTDDGERVACKHLLGLKPLVDEEVAYWDGKAAFTGDYRREIQYVRLSRALTEAMKRVGK